MTVFSIKKILLLMFIALGLGIGGGGLGCAAEMIGSNPITCGNITCPANSTCAGGICVPPCAFTTPGNGSDGSACANDGDCDSNDCDNATQGSSCTCVGGGTCTPVDVPANSVPFNGACDQNEDCANELPCIDCVCV